jgi:hypothetical protein
MIRKFVEVPSAPIRYLLWLVILFAAIPMVSAQQSPTEPASAQQQPEISQSPQEPLPEESTSRRKAKVPNYKKWTFNVGGGASLTNGTTHTFVRGGGGVGAAGVARNYSRFFGIRLDVQFDNLPLRNTALEQAQAPGANSHVYSANLDPIINIPATKLWTGYIVGGLGFYHRTGKLDSSNAIPGAACTPFFTWWGRCYSGSLPLNGNFLAESVNELGLNFGAGLARKIRPNIEVYAEFRDMHGSHRGITTDLRPITVGVRW